MSRHLGGAFQLIHPDVSCPVGATGRFADNPGFHWAKSASIWPKLERKRIVLRRRWPMVWCRPRLPLVSARADRQAFLASCCLKLRRGTASVCCRRAGKVERRRRSAMERYDARFWRNSTMTSFAGIKSWNFCGRRGVNASTALRTAAGSKEDIRLNVADVNRETDRRRFVHAIR